MEDSSELKNAVGSFVESLEKEHKNNKLIEDNSKKEQYKKSDGFFELVSKLKKIIEMGDSRYENRNEVKEVYNSINALNYIQKGFKFNIPSIKRLYYVLTKDLTMSDGNKYPRGFKEVENIVNNQPTMTPNQVEWALESLLEKYRENKKETYPIQLAFDFHLRYEYIHPFLDGNGRTGRLIMNKILIGK